MGERLADIGSAVVVVGLPPDTGTLTTVGACGKSG